ncbi:hypothetical protein MPSEU_000757400 [Mayamaea pseudoterrestris]|nr:hypothetical protein MPSEU_000757400 [Mayamaea pseudoterrestris]
MKSNSSLIALLLTALTLQNALAFSVKSLPLQARQINGRRLAPQFAMLGDDESEWYSPSTASAAIPKPPMVSVPRHASCRIRDLDGRADYDDFVSSPNDDRLSVILFHASWCKTCLKILQQYKKMATQVADHVDIESNDVIRQGSLRLAQLEYSKHTELCQELGIVKLPTIQLYRNGEQLASFSCGANKFGRVREIIQEFDQQQQTLVGSSHSELQKLEQIGDSIKRAIQNSGSAISSLTAPADDVALESRHNS